MQRTHSATENPLCYYKICFSNWTFFGEKTPCDSTFTNSNRLLWVIHLKQTLAVEHWGTFAAAVREMCRKVYVVQDLLLSWGRHSNSQQPCSVGELSPLPEDYTAQMSEIKGWENTHEAATLDIYRRLWLVCWLHSSLNHLTFKLLGF